MSQDPKGERQTPVPWEKLKELQDENVPMLSGCGPIVGIMLLVSSCFSFLVAFAAALDPDETVEPVRFLVLTAIAFGLMSGWWGALFLMKR